MKKLLATILAVGMTAAAFAGLDTYTGKNFTTVLTPTDIADGSSTSVTNSTVTGVNVAGLPGNGALVIGLSTGNGAGTLTATLSACATTNGTYATCTNAGVAVSAVVTNGSAFRVLQIVPNSQSQYWRLTVTPSAVATGQCASAVLITN